VITTGQIAIIASAVLALAAGFIACLWKGVLVLSFSLRVVPPWNRKAPEKKQATTNSAVPAAGENPVAGTAGPKPVRERAA
jgi:hypothetical protein